MSRDPRGLKELMGDCTLPATAGMVGRSSHKGRTNIAWLIQGTPLWVTEEAAFGICPGDDDFLFWDSLQKNDPYRIPAADKAIADFYQHVLPAIGTYRQAAATLKEQEWQCGVDESLQLVVPATVKGTNSLTTRTARPKRPSRSGVDNAAKGVLTALEAFAKRHDARRA